MQKKICKIIIMVFSVLSISAHQALGQALLMGNIASPYKRKKTIKQYHHYFSLRERKHKAFKCPSHLPTDVLLASGRNEILNHAM